MKLKYIILLLVVFVSCSEDKKEPVIQEPVIQLPVNQEPEPKSIFEYKTYKQIAPMTKIESYYLSRHADIEKISREILKIYDSQN